MNVATDFECGGGKRLTKIGDDHWYGTRISSRNGIERMTEGCS